jgi:hypothetical protein
MRRDEDSVVEVGGLAMELNVSVTCCSELSDGIAGVGSRNGRLREPECDLRCTLRIVCIVHCAMLSRPVAECAFCGVRGGGVHCSSRPTMCT